MKPRVQGGVVDSRLNVYGVTNLKVAGKNFFRPYGESRDNGSQMCPSHLGMSLP